LTSPDPAPSSPADPPSPQRRDDPNREGQLTDDCRGRGLEFYSPVTETGAPPAGLRRGVVEREDVAADGIENDPWTGRIKRRGIFCKEKDG
jgi:hypothetical protein